LATIVHGGWDGGWFWKRPAEDLRKRGHEVYTPAVPHGLTRPVGRAPSCCGNLVLCRISGVRVFAYHRNAPVRFSPTKVHASHILLPIDRIRPIGSPYLAKPGPIPLSNWVISAWSDSVFQSGVAIGQNLTTDYFLMTFRQPPLLLIYSDARSVIYILKV
jgi:hypothetical protein